MVATALALAAFATIVGRTPTARLRLEVIENW
jgi:hypothetical protein